MSAWLHGWLAACFSARWDQNAPVFLWFLWVLVASAVALSTRLLLRQLRPDARPRSSARSVCWRADRHPRRAAAAAPSNATATNAAAVAAKHWWVLWSGSLGCLVLCTGCSTGCSAACRVLPGVCPLRRHPALSWPVLGTCLAVELHRHYCQLHQSSHWPKARTISGCGPPFTTAGDHRFGAVQPWVVLVLQS